MLRVGLTGGIGSGKTEAANLFAKLGIPVIDTDIIAHELTRPNTPTLKQIIDTFGTEYLRENEHLNRALLSKTIFNNPEKKVLLENIIHPQIQKSVEQQLIEVTESPYVIIVVPLLFETSFKGLVDLTLVVDASVEQQVERTHKRDGKSCEQIMQIIKHQIPRESRLSYADNILLNTGTHIELENAVNALHRQYLESQGA